MATRNCWACGSRAHMTLVDVQSHDEHDPFHYDRVLVQGFYTCDQCHRGASARSSSPTTSCATGQRVVPTHDHDAARAIG